MSLTFELVAESHLPYIQNLASDPAIGAMSHVASPYPSDGAKQWFEQSKDLEREGKNFDFVLFAENELVGVCGLRIVPEEMTGSIGLWVGKPYWRQGYASRATRYLIDLSFRKHNLSAITSESLVQNRVSTHILEKAGFHLTGVVVDHLDKWGRESVKGHFFLSREMWRIGLGTLVNGE